VSHIARDKAKLLARVRRLKGQLEAVERAVEAEAPCGDILQLLASIRGALGGLTGEVIEGHLHDHVLRADSESERADAIEELAEVLRTYVR
jgi:DNA-binding FrmR family transcriptional regulator